MKHEDHKRLAAELARKRSAMAPDDLKKFTMLRKRLKDDEELDSLSANDLEVLYGRYVKKRSRGDAEDLWKKLTSNE